MSGIVCATVDLEGIERVQSTWSMIRLPEASSYHKKWFESRTSDYGDDVRKLIEQGMSVTAVNYLEAQAMKNELYVNFLRTFNNLDFLISATVPIPPVPIGRNRVNVNGEVDLRAIASKLTLPFNVCGFRRFLSR